MRITGGLFKGRRLAAPLGEETRPTADRTKEALFNILRSREILSEESRIADIFAGSGALGLEALSRGGGSVCFVDQNAAARRAIRANIKTLGLESKSQILAHDARHLPPQEQAFDLIFMDPPYFSGLGLVLLPDLAQKGWLNRNALIVIEMAKNEEFTLPEGFILEDLRNYGAAKLAFIAPLP